MRPPTPKILLPAEHACSRPGIPHKARTIRLSSMTARANAMNRQATRPWFPADFACMATAEIGYESEAAFSRAFKKMMGVPPSAWRQVMR